MSNPLSRLSSFRSYSYYHVLVMCDSSQTADEVAKSTELNVWDHATSDTSDVGDSTSIDLGPYNPKKTDSGGRYVVLINGSVDATYTIERASWTSATGAQAVPGDRSTSIAVEGSVTISEPKGIAFLDQIVRCCVALGVDSAQVVYVLKTFFVGDNQFINGDGSDYGDVITDTPPITFIVYDVTGTFTEAGGTYEMQFVAGGHGATRLPQYSRAVNAMSITGGTTLAATLKALETNINDSYDKYFECVHEQVEKFTNSDDLLNALCRVKYVIEVGADYSGANESKYTVSNQPAQTKNAGSCDEPAQMTFPPHTSIEEAIGRIMKMSTQVQNDMAQGDSATKVKYEYKIHSALVSSRPTDTEAGTINYTVYYRVERFAVPKTIVYDPSFQVLQGDNPPSDPGYAAIKRNIIEFDYIYTGKNIDILEMDMKVNMGLAYLQTATLANTFKNQRERAANRVMQPSSAGLNNQASRFGGKKLMQVPVFFGSQIKSNDLINSQNASNAIQTAYTLTNHSSLEVTDVTMRIIGNAEMLGCVNKTTSPEYVVASKNRAADPTAPDGVASFADWSHAPAYVKVNIMMPRNNNDFSLYTGTSVNGPDSSQDYAQPFWYDGYYYVVGIEHVFDSGDFTQTLQLLGLPKANAFTAAQSNTQAEQSISSGVGKCFDNQIGDTSESSTTTPTVATTPPTGSTDPTNKADADTTNSNTNGDPSVVRGWSTASPAVQQAIRNAAARNGVDVVTLAQFAAQESSFKPSATPGSASSAVGLFQFITGTWNNLIHQNAIIGATTADLVVPGSGVDARTDPDLNAMAGAAYLKQNTGIIKSSDVGDLYLAHFLGPDPARTIIAADNAGRGNLPAYVGYAPAFSTDARAQKAYNQAASANPSYFPAGQTIHGLRAAAALAMSKQLIGNVAVARQKKATSAAAPAAAAGAPGTANPSANPANSKRTAGSALAAQQGVKAQAAKTDTNPCNAGPTNAQDSSTDSSGVVNSPVPDDPNQIQSFNQIL